MTDLAIVTSAERIVVPKAPDYTTDRHHTFWPKPDYESDTARQFRRLSCFVSRVDAYAHKALHFCYAPPKQPDPDIMALAKERHKSRNCTCWEENESKKQLVNLLALRRGVGLEIPCISVMLDPWAISLIEAKSARPRPLPQEWAEYLHLRHERGQCGCPRPALKLVAS